MINDDKKASMPVYDGILSDEDIIASKSYIKFMWPEEVAEIHDKIHYNCNAKTDWTYNRAPKSNATDVHINWSAVVDQLVSLVKNGAYLKTGVFGNFL